MNAKVIIAVGLLVAAVTIGVTSFKQTMTPYISFAEAKGSNGQVQVNGMLADHDYVLKAQEQYLRFNLKDSKGEVMPVEYHGVVPGNFAQAVGVVAIGEFQKDHFEASQLLVKCPSKYQDIAKKQAQQGVRS